MPPSYLSASDMNTAAAKARKSDVYDDYDKKRTKFKAQQKKKKKKKKKPAGAAAPHASTLKDLEGVLAKDAYYAQNCHDYLDVKDPGRCAVFESFDMAFAHKHTKKSMKALDRYRFNAYDENFNPGAKCGKKKAGQRYPYVWEAHHMLPGSAFYYEEPPKGPCFEAWQIRLILQSKYNINHGHNMIPLPDRSWPVMIHQVPQHPGDHPVYTQVVMKWLRAVARDLAKLKAKKASHPDMKDTVFDDLKTKEDDAWKFLVRLGKRLARLFAAGKKTKVPWVTYGTEDNPKKFPRGALY